ncbi:MAG: carbon-nitrogen hydrolase family protein, partial [Gemmatimonadetes bacterium]|nr:carbon-nitrogen hydrolase family protein [Gemmatimonadota bacterium]
MRLALIQNHCSPDRDENLERALNSMEQAKESGADMVIFPELAVDRFFP